MAFGIVLLICARLAVLPLQAGTLYVNQSNLTPLKPYDTWPRAATKIQDAIDEASENDMVVVTNGVYDAFTLSANRIKIDKAITVRSVNGPSHTFLVGGSNIRCAWVASNASLCGFTLTNGQTRTTGNEIEDQSGGGVWCQKGAVISNCLITGCSAKNKGGGVYEGAIYHCEIRGNWSTTEGGGVQNAQVFDSTITGNLCDGDGGGIATWVEYAVERCVIEDNEALDDGGGVYGGALRWCTVRGNRAGKDGGGTFCANAEYCLISSNSAANGGGSHSAQLRNCFVYGNIASIEGGGCDQSGMEACTVVDNESGQGGGVYGSRVTNSIVYYNRAFSDGPNYYDTSLKYSCVDPLPTDSSLGIVTNAPGLLGLRNPHILPASPCVNSGLLTAWMTNAPDIDGELRTNGISPDIGCDEYCSAGMTGLLTVAVRVPCTNVAAGLALRFEADIQGRAEQFTWSFGDGTIVSNTCFVMHAFESPSDYNVILAASNKDGCASATVAIHVVSGYTNYVAAGGSHTPPFTSWSSAATNIQSAINANPVAGGVVLVTNGLYDTGDTIVFGQARNRIAITNPVIVRSVNGPATTTIRGQQEFGPIEPVRCAWVGSMARLEGFTLTNGNTCSGRDDYREDSGGGAWCQAGAVLTNCILTGCHAVDYGGGVLGGTLYNCKLVGNAGDDAGGGANGSVLSDCTLSGNHSSLGGGACRGTLSRCTVSSNSASSSGGGVNAAHLWHCTLSDNHSGGTGGGAHDSRLWNCAVYGNDAVFGGGIGDSSAYSCTVVNNAATAGGGAYDCWLANCVIYYNRAALETLDMSLCIGENLCSPVAGITNSPGILGFRNPHLTTGSSCIRAGTNEAWMTGQTDLDGDARILDANVDIGCDEYGPHNLTGTLNAAIMAFGTNAVVGSVVRFASDIMGKATGYVWEINGHARFTNECLVEYAHDAASDYSVVLRAWNSDRYAAATTKVHVASGFTNYVDLLGGNTPPYESWDQAARNIQDAIGACYIGGTVLVTNGTYMQGTTLYYSELPSRIVLTNGVKVRSVNGPATTTIRGIGPIGPTAVRCAYLAKGAELHGFTLAEGHTLLSSDFYLNIRGGGAWCENETLISNCMVRECRAGLNGGGVYQGELHNCTLADNEATGNGGATENSILYDCVVTGNTCTIWGGGMFSGQAHGGLFCNNQARNGGAAYGGLLFGVRAENNAANKSGGAFSSCYATNCVITGNYAGSEGGGLYSSEAYNCTITANVADTNSMGEGGGVSSCYGVYDSTISGNRAAYGGGSSGSTLWKCRVMDNTAVQCGGGLHNDTAWNCAILGNRAGAGGGAYNAEADNCTVVNNAADTAGGTYSGTLHNCIVYYNRASLILPDISGGIVQYSCVPHDSGGIGNLTNAPGLAGLANPHIISDSVCRNAGVFLHWMTNAVDIDGESFGSIGSIDIGCDQFRLAGITGDTMPSVTAAYTTVAAGYTLGFIAALDNKAVGYEWRWGDGSTGASQCVIGHVFTNTGIHDIVLSAWNNDGVCSTTIRVSVVDRTVRYVAPGGNHVFPYTNWVTAATNIQAAIAETVIPGDLVLVSNGFYNSGEVIVGDHMPSRLAITNPITVTSVNGPECTTIAGGWPRGPTGVRCAYVGSGAELSGFTLSNGNTRTAGDADKEQSGAGAWCEPEAILSNCVIRNCSAALHGGGSYGGTLRHCVLTRNYAANNGGATTESTLQFCHVSTNEAGGYGGAANDSAMYDCEVRQNTCGSDGGGACDSTLERCLLIQNIAGDDGGAAAYSSLRQCTAVSNRAAEYGGAMLFGYAENCLLWANSCGADGGGAYDASMGHCTIVRNDAENRGGGVCDGFLWNCIVFHNTATNGDPDVQDDSDLNCSFSCLGQSQAGPGNITNAPVFRDLANHDFRLQASSPCIDTATNRNVVWDMSETPRPLDGNDDGVPQPDMGVYEFVSDKADTDGDGFADAQEVIASTGLLDIHDFFHIEDAPRKGPFTLVWTGVPGRLYTVFATTNLMSGLWTNDPGFTDVPGTSDRLTYSNRWTTTNFFFRVGVRLDD
jgi:hypothetical protein